MSSRVLLVLLEIVFGLVAPNSVVSSSFGLRLRLCCAPSVVQLTLARLLQWSLGSCGTPSGLYSLAVISAGRWQAASLRPNSPPTACSTPDSWPAEHQRGVAGEQHPLVRLLALWLDSLRGRAGDADSPGPPLSSKARQIVPARPAGLLAFDIFYMLA